MIPKIKHSHDDLHDISLICFPFYLNKENKYVCLFRYHNETKDYVASKTQEVYKRSQSFIYECLKDPKHREYFHEMIENKLNEFGLLNNLNERNDIMYNSFRNTNQTNDNVDQSDLNNITNQLNETSIVNESININDIENEMNQNKQIINSDESCQIIEIRSITNENGNKEIDSKPSRESISIIPRLKDHDDGIEHNFDVPNHILPQRENHSIINSQRNNLNDLFRNRNEIKIVENINIFNEIDIKNYEHLFLILNKSIPLIETHLTQQNQYLMKHHLNMINYSMMIHAQHCFKKKVVEKID